MSTIDLTKVNKHSMSSVLQDNMNQINLAYYSGSANKMTEVVSDLFKKAGINTKASNRLLTNLRKARTATEAMFTISNSILAGSGNSVI